MQLLFQSASGEAPAGGDPSEVAEYEVPQADPKTKGGPAETPEVVVCEPCYLCRLSTVGCPRQTLNKGRPTCQFVHNCCHNAERGMQSVAAAMDKEEKSTRHMQSLKKQKQTDAAGYAKEILNFILKEGEVRDQMWRARVRRWVEEIVRHHTAEKVNGVRMLPKRAFVAYMINQEGLDREEAIEEWQNSIKDANVHKENVGGIMKVAVKLHTDYLVREGMTKNKRCRDESDIASDRDQGQAMKRLKQTFEGTDALMGQVGGVSFNRGAEPTSKELVCQVLQRRAPTAGNSVCGIRIGGTISCHPQPAESLPSSSSRTFPTPKSPKEEEEEEEEESVQLPHTKCFRRVQNLARKNFLKAGSCFWRMSAPQRKS